MREPVMMIIGSVEGGGVFVATVVCAGGGWEAESPLGGASAGLARAFAGTAAISASSSGRLRSAKADLRLNAPVVTSMPLCSSVIHVSYTLFYLITS
jgi:hypothetical protein